MQIVSAVRRRLGPLGLDSCWHGVVDRMRPLVEPDRMARQVRDLAGWLLSRSPRTTTNGDKATRSGQMLSQLATYLYFATTVLDVFSETHFDRTAAHATRGSCGSFEYLAEAGREIGVSHDSSLNMLSRFRIT